MYPYESISTLPAASACMQRYHTQTEQKLSRDTTGKVMVGTAILLFIIIIIVILFHTYVRFYRRRHRLLAHTLPTSAVASGEPRLEPSVLKALPTFTFSAGVGQRAPEDCAVCLSEFNDDDEGRVLPNYGHDFHAHCIDAWFASHSTCPLYRTTVRPEASAGKAEADSVAEAGDGCSSSLQLPAAVACPRKAMPLSIIVEVERGSDSVSGDQGLRWTLKRFCSD